ncbi:DUF2130 domain-containing protein [Candidatus Gracilibacteria bacterium]|nr:DUF2130 domain-containing protein [Candidatus Gracilibacteria bacterium]
MKKIKVSIKDENTLVLLEDATQGDIIDLSSLHDVDIDTTTIKNVVQSIKMDQFNAKLKEKTEAIERENKRELEAIQRENDLKLSIKEKELAEKAKEALNNQQNKITELHGELKNIAEKSERDAENKILKERERIKEQYEKELKAREEQLSKIQYDKDLSEERLKDQLKASETALVHYKEMKTKMSTKMIGESLELHCENEFNRIRSIAFPNAEFGKDNTISEIGTKGDYIYREVDSQGNELLSIMFEMKNEIETTATKKKNSDFFKKLDKDRNEKKCEYAVLVSLLEKDNEYYDDIVTVHDYKLMYAIRPQHFITIIGFLRQANTKSQSLQSEIHRLNNQNIDVSNFESNMNEFKEAFGKNYILASKQFSTAIEEIDKTIDHLNKVKDNLLKSDNNLRLANNKASDLSIKRLTKDSPSVAIEFEKQK